MYNRLKCKRVQRIHVQKYVAPTQEVCFYQKQSYLFSPSFSLSFSNLIIYLFSPYFVFMDVFRPCCT